MIPFPHTVTVVRPGTTTDRYDNTLPDWDAATRTASPAWVQQTSSFEPHADGRRSVVTTWKVFLPAELAIAAGDRVEWESRSFEVDGDPYPLTGPAGPDHTECALRRVVG